MTHKVESSITQQFAQLSRIAPSLGVQEFFTILNAIATKAESSEGAKKALTKCQVKYLKLTHQELQARVAQTEQEGRRILRSLKTPSFSSVKELFEFYKTFELPEGAEQFLASAQELKAGLQLAKIEQLRARLVANGAIKPSICQASSISSTVDSIGRLAEAIQETQTQAQFLSRTYQERQDFSLRLETARATVQRELTNAQARGDTSSLSDNLARALDTYAALRATLVLDREFCARQEELETLIPSGLPFLPKATDLMQEYADVEVFQQDVNLFREACAHVRRGNYDQVTDAALERIQLSRINLSSLRLAILQNLDFVLGRPFLTNVQEAGLEERLKEITRLFTHLPAAQTENYAEIEQLLKQMRAYKNVSTALEGERLDLVAPEDLAMLQNHEAVHADFLRTIETIRKSQEPVVVEPTPEPVVIESAPKPTILAAPSVLEIGKNSPFLLEEDSEDESLPQPTPPQALPPEPGRIARFCNWIGSFFSGFSRLGAYLTSCFSTSQNRVVPAVEDVDPFAEHEIR